MHFYVVQFSCKNMARVCVLVKCNNKLFCEPPFHFLITITHLIIVFKTVVLHVKTKKITQRTRIAFARGSVSEVPGWAAGDRKSRSSRERKRCPAQTLPDPGSTAGSRHRTPARTATAADR